MATFAVVVVGCLAAQIYQTTTGRGVASDQLKETLKDAMLVLAGLLASSRQAVAHAPTDTQNVQVVNDRNDPVPVSESADDLAGRRA